MSSVVRWLDEVAAYWLGESLPPVHRALADWTRDDRSLYCPRCGDSVGAGEVVAGRCGHCRDASSSADGLVRLGAYRAPLREWILEIKYRSRWAEMAIALGGELGEAVRDAQVVTPERAVVIPMPMPLGRRFFRGIDHAALIAEGAAVSLDAPLAHVLRRPAGVPQAALARSQRARAGRQGLGRRVGWRRGALAGREVVLVDDVRTTGASIRAAARMLRPLGPVVVIAAVVAVAESPGRARENTS